MTPMGPLVRLALAGCLISATAIAKVSPEEAKQLDGPRLTAFGAEAGANADGSIPAYTGPLTAARAGVTVPASGLLPDPFASEKPLYVVTAANMAQYGSLVTPGVAATLRQYPTFHLNVYPTHRTSGYPAWVLANMRRNAVTGELTGDIEGDGFKNAYGGAPFPIPKNGYEVLWNGTTAWDGVAIHEIAGGDYFVDASGTVTLTQRTEVYFNYTYYDPDATSDPSGFFYKLRVDTTAPASQDGTLSLTELSTDYARRDQVTYIYTLGQRRVRLAPEFKYDTPIAQNGGAFLYDEYNLYAGRPDRFDFKLIGKREILIPYNDFKSTAPGVTVADWMTPHHPNPDLIRWEKHRVWVVDGTLKPGARHIYSRRTLYIDEDSWDISTTDAYDHSGALYRVCLALTYPVYNAPYPTTFNGSDVYLNLGRENYAATQFFAGNNDGRLVYLTHPYPESMFSPEQMAGSGVR